MKKSVRFILPFTLIIAALVIFSGCTKGPHHEKGLSPTETVQQYVDYLNEMNVRGIESLYLDPKAADNAMDFLEFKEFILDECVEDTKLSTETEKQVRLTGTYVHRNISGYTWEFDYYSYCHLVKDENGEWKISRWG